jgi:hypothetical protein
MTSRLEYQLGWIIVQMVQLTMPRTALSAIMFVTEERLTATALA